MQHLKNRCYVFKTEITLKEWKLKALSLEDPLENHLHIVLLKLVRLVFWLSNNLVLKFLVDLQTDLSLVFFCVRGLVRIVFKNYRARG